MPKKRRVDAAAAGEPHAAGAGALASVLVEVCCDSVASCRAAAAAGAGRIELCVGLVDGGVTPSVGLVAAAAAAVPIPVVVLIRPRPGDFVFDEDEIAVMVRDVAALAGAGAKGVVVGALDRDGGPDVPTLRKLVDAASAVGVPCTFHRAIDMARDPLEVLAVCKELGFERILTSGGSATALAGASTIANLVSVAEGSGVAIMAGGGVTEDNAKDIADRTGVTQLHGSFRVQVPCATRFRKFGVHMGASKENTDETEFFIKVADSSRVARAVKQVADAEVRHHPTLARVDRVKKDGSAPVA